MKQQAHDILGVPEDADEDLIKKAYRKKSKAAHPDSGGSAEQFHTILIAYKEMMHEDMPPSNHMGMISGVYNNMIEQYKDNIVYINVPQEIARHFQKVIGEATKDITSIQTRIKLFERINKCIKTDNFIRAINNNRISEYKKQIKSAKHAIKDMKCCQELLANTDFTPEERPVTVLTTSVRWNAFQFSEE